MKKDKNKIPKGLYCYTYKDEKIVTCPYWSKDKTPGRNEQENGYCSYLGKSDWEINEEIGPSKAMVYESGKPVNSFIVKPHEFTMSLLWDKCKECDIRL